MKILFFIGGALCGVLSNYYVMNQLYDIKKKDNGDK